MEGSELLDQGKDEFLVLVGAPFFEPMLQFPKAKAACETKLVGQDFQVKMEGLPWRMCQAMASAWRVFSVYTQSVSRTAIGRIVKRYFRRRKHVGESGGDSVCVRPEGTRIAGKGVADSVLARGQHNRNMVGAVGV